MTGSTRRVSYFFSTDLSSSPALTQLDDHEPLKGINEPFQGYEFVSGADRFCVSLALARLHALPFDPALHIRREYSPGPKPDQVRALMALWF